MRSTFSVLFYLKRKDVRKEGNGADVYNTEVVSDVAVLGSILWRISGRYLIVERLSVGAGGGWSFYKKTLIAVFADVKFLIMKLHKFTPFLACRIGYAFAPVRHANGGFYLNPNIGVLYAVSQRHNIFTNVGSES